MVEIAAGAFTNAACREIILPDTLRRIEPGAFTGCAVESLTLFDNLQTVSDYAFAGCTALRTLHINAATAPVYSGSYYATFADKYDRLLSLSKTRKLVLFSGSSARFGYDSAALDQALPSYAVVNMGVFAYTNALPQLELIRSQLQEGDLLLLSPSLTPPSANSARRTHSTMTSSAWSRKTTICSPCSIYASTAAFFRR